MSQGESLLILFFILIAVVSILIYDDYRRGKIEEVKRSQRETENLLEERRQLYKQREATKKQNQKMQADMKSLNNQSLSFKNYKTKSDNGVDDHMNATFLNSCISTSTWTSSHCSDVSSSDCSSSSSSD